MFHESGLGPLVEPANSDERAIAQKRLTFAALWLDQSAHLPPSVLMARFDFISVYLLANRKNGALYLGVTSDLLSRIEQHKQGKGSGHTEAYGIDRLVWFEQHATLEAAYVRERAIKRWKRAWKIDLIEAGNPGWNDLSLAF